MASHLGSLPVEVLETITSRLDIGDVCSLRLTARELAVKTSQKSYKALFVSKSVNVSRESLQALVKVTQRGWMGCALERLTIFTIAPSSDDEFHDLHDQNVVELLQQAFTNLQVNSTHKCLRSLDLVVKGRTENGTLTSLKHVRDWHSIWKCADRTARLVGLAAKLSSIKIEKLDLYSTTLRCALSLRQLESVLDLPQTHELKSLSLAVSASKPHGDLENTSRHLCHLISSSPELEHLDLRWFNIHGPDQSDMQLDEKRFFAGVPTLAMPFLQSVSLRGITTSEEALLSFLEGHPRLVQISLEEFHLEQGHFRSIFVHLTEHLKLDSLCLDDLWEGVLIQFPGSAGEPHFPHPDGPTWIKRTGLETQREIVYRPMRGHVKASAKASNWHRRKASLYGPF